MWNGPRSRYWTCGDMWGPVGVPQNLPATRTPAQPRVHHATSQAIPPQTPRTRARTQPPTHHAHTHAPSPPPTTTRPSLYRHPEPQGPPTRQGGIRLPSRPRPCADGPLGLPHGANTEVGPHIEASGRLAAVPRHSHPQPIHALPPNRPMCHLSPRLTSPRLTSHHLTSPHLASPHLTLPPLTSPHLTSPHLIPPHLTSPYLSIA